MNSTKHIDVRKPVINVLYAWPTDLDHGTGDNFEKITLHASGSVFAPFDDLLRVQRATTAAPGRGYETKIIPRVPLAPGVCRGGAHEALFGAALDSYLHDPRSRRHD